MVANSSLRRCSLRLLCCAALLLAGTASASERGDDAEDDTLVSGASSFGGNEPSYLATATPEGQQISASFRDFNNQALTVRFTLEQQAAQQSVSEFGVSGEELEAMKQVCMSTPGCDQSEFDRRTTLYYRTHAMRLKQESGKAPTLFVDVAQVVERNRGRVKPVAVALQRLAAERGLGPEWMVEAAVALVQTGLVYKRPGTLESGRKIIGFYPPPLALERGYGDCDTKSALLAAIIKNITDTRIVGVHVPRHYLIGIAGPARADQAAIQYEQQSYVLVEAAGPAQRRPGDVSDVTQAALARDNGYRVDPMF